MENAIKSPNLSALKWAPFIRHNFQNLLFTLCILVNPIKSYMQNKSDSVLGHPVVISLKKVLPYWVLKQLFLKPNYVNSNF